MEGADKKHEPSAKRLRQALQEGRIPRSTKLRELVVTLIGIVLVVYGTPFALVHAKDLLDYSLAYAASDPYASLEESLQFVAVTSLFALGVVSVLGLACGFVQTRFAFSPGVLAPRCERLNPAKGFSKIYRGATQLHLWGGQYLASLLVIGFALIWCSLTVGETKNLTAFFLGSGSILCAAFVLSAGVDLLKVRRDYRQQLFMSDEELRRELREDEGDPWVKGARRGMHEEIIMAELVQRIRRSKVIVVERATAEASVSD